MAEVLAWAEHYQEAADAQTGQPLDLSSLPGRGDQAALAKAVLSNPNIELRPEAEADVRAGRVDPRVLAVLLALAERFSLAGVGPFVSGHSYYVAGTNRPSNHAFGRAVDIGTINRRARLTGERRRPASRARARLACPRRCGRTRSAPPSPSSAALPGLFSDAAHQDHLHLGFDR